METQVNPESNFLESAFLTSTFDSIGDEKIAVMTEDLITPGIDYSKHYFEPEVGSSYIIKFLPNPGGKPIEHRAVYKKLPDPERKGKTLFYISSGNSKTCKALELFFELNALKKDGDAIAEKKIDLYMKKTNEGCSKIQILHSPKPEQIGQIRLMKFSTFGPAPIVANLLQAKLNPTKEQIAADFEREDIFNIFESSVLNLICEEEIFEGNKGRGYGKSSWTPKKRGAIAEIELPDGTKKVREFKKTDVVNGAISEEVKPFFQAFSKKVTSDDYSVYTFFSHKEVDDARNSKDLNDYLKSLYAKVDEIVPIIREKSLAEIEKYGKAVANTGTSTKPDNAKNIMTESLPPELAGSVMNASENTPANAPKADKPKETKSEAANDVDDILNS